jgi:hypothetical protein
MITNMDSNTYEGYGEGNVKRRIRKGTLWQ